MNIKQNNFFKKSLLSLAVISAMSTAFVASASTESKAKDIEVLTVTATRTHLNIDDALTSQVVITRADIELANPISFLDLLSTVPSIDIATNGGRGQNASIFMRGTNSDHTLILIDGVRVSSATSGGTNLNTISPEMIERIEIVQGPRAALWGSDAIGGVIQIFTRQLSAGELFAGASFGTDNYQKYKAGAGISHGDGQTTITVSKEESDGYDVQEGAETDDDGYDFTSVAIRGQQKITEDFSVEWLLSSDSGDNEYDGYYNGSDFNNHTWLVRANYATSIKGVNNKTVFSVGQSRDSIDSLSNGLSQGIFETRRNQYSIVNNSQLSDDLQVNIGVDYYQDDVSKSSIVFDKEERDTTGVFAHTLYTENAWTFEATLRHDSVEDVNSENTYNFGVGHKVDEDTRVVLNYGTGFKVPTYNDLFYPGFGTPTLDSELSETVELFFETKISEVNTSVSLYRSKIDDLIGQKDGVAANFAKVEINGLELSANYAGFGGMHDVNLSYTDAEDQSTTDNTGRLSYEQLIRRAKEKFNYKFVTTVSAVDVYAEYQFVGAREDAVFGIGKVDLASYQLINLGLNYDVSQNFSVSSRITNLLDKAYQTASGFNSQERALYLGITYHN
ncbi:TonB-dependent receptor domain-containing protein [Colwellia sp. MB3u-4]|uniref:TonB-dependent receptor domain-containing protein n=1 Tax=Colwellia sp. MB3u-4 TaxID=2759822 RepID=UPI0015F381A3|nr:TonB-dependent receptor [Colwellia sp. MB3u-4]MBA6288718.1 TonB-dependent receptor [Colwellia sp. MB3u-4]